MLRPYRTDNDVWAMRRFLQRGWQVAGPHCGLFHPGDLSWQRYQQPPAFFPAEERIVLWEQPDGEIAGYAWYYQKHQQFLISIDPSLAGTAAWQAIAGELATWAEAKSTADSAAKFTTSALMSDPHVTGFLAARGYERSDDDMMRSHEIDVVAGVPKPVMPEGFCIVPMVEDADLAQRVEIHRDVWAPSRFTLESYRNVRAAPGYDPELDLVAVAADGTFAAYAICWHDEINRNGEFEPVGTREAFRGRGLARAVLHEGLTRLRERNCTHGYVFSMDDSEPACQLYRSAGFHINGYWVTYQRPVE